MQASSCVDIMFSFSWGKYLGVELLNKCMFKLIRHLETVFQGGCAILHSHQPCIRYLTDTAVQQQEKSSFLRYDALLKIKRIFFESMSVKPAGRYNHFKFL